MTDSRTPQEKRADTIARNKLKEIEEGLRLEQETSGGRSTKHRALQNAIWNEVGGRKRAAPTTVESAAKKPKNIQSEAKVGHARKGSTSGHNPREGEKLERAINRPQNSRPQNTGHNGEGKQRPNQQGGQNHGMSFELQDGRSNGQGSSKRRVEAEHTGGSHYTEYIAAQDMNIDRWERPKQQLTIKVRPVNQNNQDALSTQPRSKVKPQNGTQNEDEPSEEEDEYTGSGMEEDFDDKDDNEAFDGEINEVFEQPVWRNTARGNNTDVCDHNNSDANEDQLSTYNQLPADATDTTIQYEEEQEDNHTDVEPEESLPQTLKPKKKQSSRRVVSGKRQKAREAEQPHWGTQPRRAILDSDRSNNSSNLDLGLMAPKQPRRIILDSDRSNDSSSPDLGLTTDNSNYCGSDEDGNDDGTSNITGPPWPASTRLIYEDSQRYIGLKAQTDVMKSVIHAGFDGAYRYALFHDMFPPSDDIDIVFRTLLHKAALSVNALEIANRLKYDPAYGDMISHLVKPRFLNVRSELRKYTYEKIEHKYGLQPGCSAKVEALITDNNFTYGRNTSGHAVASKPYQHDAILVVLKWFFQEKTSIGQKNLKSFTTSIPGNTQDDEHEITIPMLAGTVTMIYADILEWRSGNRIRTKFDADEYIGIYRYHLSVLQRIKTSNITKFHRLMAKLFVEATSGMKGSAPRLDENRALALIDFANMSD